ncbi:MAG: hypothetical protein FE048_00295 [Thermoplasmata archaeon]|nr:MAG: hypothetical protein FE048_00295 [Thermoplasmata archaeon]
MEICYPHVFNKKFGSIIILLLLSSVSLSGCIGPKEISQKLMEKFGKKEKYEWNKKLEVEQNFKVWDIINVYVAKVETYSFVIAERTRYLHITIETTFSNVFNLDWECLNLGYVNMTVTDPFGENMSKEYSTVGKDYRYKNFIYITDPQPGTWKVTIKVTGVGTFKIFAEAYEPA